MRKYRTAGSFAGWQTTLLGTLGFAVGFSLMWFSRNVAQAARLHHDLTPSLTRNDTPAGNGCQGQFRAATKTEAVPVAANGD